MDRNKIRKQAQILRNKQLIRDHRKRQAEKAKLKDKAVKISKTQTKSSRKTSLISAPPSPNKNRKQAVKTFSAPPRKGCGGCRRRASG